MDQAILLDDQIEDGRRLVEGLPRHGFEVTAACWLLESYDEKWHFYLVSPLMDTEGFSPTRDRLRSAILHVPLAWLTADDIDVIGTNDPMAKAVITDLSYLRGARLYPSYFRGYWLGNKAVQAGRFYPAAAPAEKKTETPTP